MGRNESAAKQCVNIAEGKGTKQGCARNGVRESIRSDGQLAQTHFHTVATV